MGTITVFPARKVVTMDPGRPVAEAVAVMDGKVLSTGSLRSMQPCSCATRMNGVFAEREATERAANGMPVEISQAAGVRGLGRMADVARRAGITTTAEMGSGTRGSRSTVMPTATRRSMLRSMRWRNCSGCARASTIVSRLSIVASASPPERQRALNMLWNLMPIGWRTQGILNDVRFASAPQSIAVEEIKAPTLVVSLEDDRAKTTHTVLH